MKTFLLTALFAFGFLLSFGQKKENIPLPEMESRILDLAKLLTSAQEKDIFNLIMDLETRVGSKIGIATVESLNGVPIEEFAKSLANQMALGGKKADGILIVFSFKDRKFRTEVSIGLSKIITSDVSDLINRNVMLPQFTVGNYANGFYNGVKAFSERIEMNKDKIGKRD